MAGVTRRQVVIGGVLAATALASYWMFVASDDAKISALLRRLIEAGARSNDESPEAYATRVRDVLSQILASGGVLRAPELEDSLTGAEEMSEWASDIASDFDSIRFALDQSEIKTNGDFAHVLAVITLFAKKAGIEFRDTRRVDIRLRKRGEWRIESIDVAARTYDEPEARP